MFFLISNICLALSFERRNYDPHDCWDRTVLPAALVDVHYERRKAQTMSDDLIKRSDAIEVIWGDDINPSEDGMVFEAQSHIDRDIRLIPSADRPQGEWIPATWQDEHCPERLKRHKCSECGQRAEQILVRTELVDNYYCNKAEPIFEYTHEEQLSKFCPSCGAHMKGADDEN